MLLSKNFFQLSCVFWMLVIFWLSSHSTIPIPYTNLFPGQDKLGHALIYSVLGFTFALGFCRTPIQFKCILLAALVGMLYGLSDEWHQSFVPNRDVDLFDVLADTVGGFMGGMVAKFSVKIQCIRLQETN